MDRQPQPQIVIDALAARHGGAARATVCLAPLLAGARVVARAGSIVAEGTPSDQLVLLPPAGRLELLRRLAWEAWVLPRLVRGRDTALLTWSGMLPRPIDARIVCYLSNPRVFLDGGFGNRLRRWAVKRTARAAAILVTPTAGMARIVEQAIGRPTSVVPHGVDQARFRPASEPGREVLYLGNFYPHKRHKLALAAWAALPPPRPLLRLIGDVRVAPRHATRVLAEVESLRHLGQIEVQSWIEADAVVAALHRARVLLMTSDRESFAMPLLEALSCGVPAVVCDIPLLRETGADGALYVAGDDPAHWAAAVERMLTDDETHARARAAGLRHAAGYTWESAADALSKLLVAG